MALHHHELSVAVIDAVRVTATPAASIAVLAAGGPPDEWNTRSRNKQYAPTGAALLVSPGRKLTSCLQVLKSSFPDLSHATAAFTSRNGLHVVLSVLGPALIALSFEPYCPPPALTYHRAPHATRMHLPPLLSAPIVHAAIANDGMYVAVVSEHAAVFVASTVASTNNINGNPPFGAGLPQQGSSSSGGATHTWRQLVLPVVCTGPNIVVRVEFVGSEQLVVHLGAAASTATSSSSSQEPNDNDEVRTLRLAVLHYHRDSLALLSIAQHKYRLDASSSTGRARSCPIDAVSERNRLVGNIPIEIAIDTQSGRVAALLGTPGAISDVSARVSAAVSTSSTTDSSPVGGGPKRTAWDAPPPVRITASHQQSVVLADLTLPPSLASATVVSLTRAFNVAATFESGDRDTTTENTTGSHADIAVALTFMTDGLALLAVLSRSGRVAWITPSGRLARRASVVPELDAAWQLGGGRAPRSARAVAAAMLRRATAAEALVKGTRAAPEWMSGGGPGLGNGSGGACIAPPRFALVAVPSGHHHHAPLLGRGAGDALAAAAAAAAIESDPWHSGPMLIATDGHIAALVRVPSFSSASTSLLTPALFRSPGFPVPTAHPPLSSLPTLVSALTRARELMDAVSLGVHPWTICANDADDETAAEAAAEINDLDRLAAPETARDPRWAAATDRVAREVVAAAREYSAIVVLPSSSGGTVIAPRGYVRRGSTTTTNNAPSSTAVASLRVLVAATDGMWAMCRGPRVLVAVSVVARVIRHLVSTDAGGGGDAMAAAHLVRRAESWMRHLTSFSSTSSTLPVAAESTTTPVWSLGWRWLEELLLLHLEGPVSGSLQAVLENVQILAGAATAAAVDGAVQPFTEMRTNGIPESMIQFIEQQPPGDGDGDDKGGQRQPIWFEETGIFQTKSQFLYALVRGQFNVAHAMFEQALVNHEPNDDDDDEDASSARWTVVSGWTRFVVDVIEDAAAAGASKQSPIQVPSPFDADLFVTIDPHLVNNTITNGAHTRLFDGHSFFASVLGSRNLRLCCFLLQRIANNDEGLGPWTQWWPNVVLLALASSQLLQLSNDTQGIDPESVALDAASVLDEVLAMLLVKGTTSAARFVVQCVSSGAPYLPTDLVQLFGAACMHQFDGVMRHIASVVGSALPLPGSILVRPATNPSLPVPTRQPSPSLAHLLTQSIFEGDNSEHWPADVVRAVVPLVDWIATAAHLAALSPTTTPGSTEPLLHLLRLMHCIHLRCALMDALAEYDGDLVAAARASPTITELATLALHYDDIFGEATVVAVAGAVMRASIVERVMGRSTAAAENERSGRPVKQEKRAAAAAARVVDVISGLGDLVTPRVAQMVVIEACYRHFPELSIPDGDDFTDLIPSSPNHDQATAWTAWAPGLLAHQSPLTPTAAPASAIELLSPGWRDTQALRPTVTTPETRVTALLTDGRFRAFCDEMLPVLQHSVLAVPTLTTTGGGEGMVGVSVDEQVRKLWQPVYPSLVPATCTRWVTEMVVDQAARRWALQPEEETSFMDGEYGDGMMDEDADADPVAVFHGWETSRYEGGEVDANDGLEGQQEERAGDDDDGSLSAPTTRDMPDGNLLDEQVEMDEYGDDNDQEDDHFTNRSGSILIEDPPRNSRSPPSVADTTTPEPSILVPIETDDRFSSSERSRLALAQSLTETTDDIFAIDGGESEPPNAYHDDTVDGDNDDTMRPDFSAAPTTAAVESQTQIMIQALVQTVGALAEELRQVAAQQQQQQSRSLEKEEEKPLPPPSEVGTAAPLRPSHSFADFIQAREHRFARKAMHAKLRSSHHQQQMLRQPSNSKETYPHRSGPLLPPSRLLKSAHMEPPMKRPVPSSSGHHHYHYQHHHHHQHQLLRHTDPTTPRSTKRPLLLLRSQ
ncbi:hypothetical protein BC828DRAFT_255993 [Blastocladiella britannica]|nr:hypothetical protein BC828DRAFT_255993 [Blastocladiella britannica]